jgi:hypothetical protein
MDTNDEKVNEEEPTRDTETDPPGVGEAPSGDEKLKVPIEEWIPEIPLDFHEFMRPRKTGR